jgi:hypothetical protein
MADLQLEISQLRREPGSGQSRQELMACRHHTSVALASTVIHTEENPGLASEGIVKFEPGFPQKALGVTKGLVNGGAV